MGGYSPPVLTSSGGHRSERYVSYWNAFLFTLFVQNYNNLENTSTFEINPNIHLNHYLACLKEEYDTTLHNRFFVFLLTDPSLILLA